MPRPAQTAIVADKEAPKRFLPWEVLREPVLDGKLWVVTAEDRVLGVMERKKFRTKAQALDFYATVLLGKAAVDPLANPAPAKHAVDPNTNMTDLARSGTAQFDPRGRHTDGVNLRDVGEVLASYGLDATAEIAGILMPHDVIGETGEVEGQGYQLDPKDRVKALLELLQYTKPKLKAVEVTVTAPELTEKQVDDRLRALLAKAAKRETK